MSVALEIIISKEKFLVIVKQCTRPGWMTTEILLSVNFICPLAYNSASHTTKLNWEHSLETILHVELFSISLFVSWFAWVGQNGFNTTRRVQTHVNLAPLFKKWQFQSMFRFDSGAVADALQFFYLKKVNVLFQVNISMSLVYLYGLGSPVLGSPTKTSSKTIKYLLANNPSRYFHQIL